MKSTNKVLEVILIKAVASHHQDWAKRPPEVLCAYKSTWKNITCFSPYEIFYGNNIIFPIDFEINTLIILLDMNLDLSATHKHQLDQLNELG